MLALVLGATATAHALERPDTAASARTVVGAQVAGGHVTGDADQVPTDRDKAAPHHHGGCHGDHVAAPVRVAAAVFHVVVRLGPMSTVGFDRPRSTADPAMRPPRA